MTKVNNSLLLIYIIQECNALACELTEFSNNKSLWITCAYIMSSWINVWPKHFSFTWQLGSVTVEKSIYSQTESLLNIYVSYCGKKFYLTNLEIFLAACYLRIIIWKKLSVIKIGNKNTRKFKYRNIFERLEIFSRQNLECMFLIF